MKIVIKYKVYSLTIAAFYLHVPYSPENKPPPSLISKFLHRYFCLTYKHPNPYATKNVLSAKMNV